MSNYSLMRMKFIIFALEQSWLRIARAREMNVQTPKKTITFGMFSKRIDFLHVL